MKTINVCELATVLNAYQNCISRKNAEWEEKHRDRLSSILSNLPSGSGLDNGVQFDFINSNSNRLRFGFGFHHMDENGSYDGWTEHDMVIKPSFMGGFDIKISGIDKNGIKEYLYDTFNECFTFNINYQLTNQQ